MHAVSLRDITIGVRIWVGVTSLHEYLEKFIDKLVVAVVVDETSALSYRSISVPNGAKNYVFYQIREIWLKVKEY